MYAHSHAEGKEEEMREGMIDERIIMKDIILAKLQNYTFMWKLRARCQAPLLNSITHLYNISGLSLSFRVSIGGCVVLYSRCFFLWFTLDLFHYVQENSFGVDLPSMQSFLNKIMNCCRN